MSAKKHEEDKEEKQCRIWLEETLGLHLQGTLWSNLRNGSLLCRLMNKIKPGSLKQINTSASEPEQIRQNIEQFIKACINYGIEPSFREEEFLKHQNYSGVIECLYNLFLTANLNQAISLSREKTEADQLDSTQPADFQDVEIYGYVMGTLIGRGEFAEVRKCLHQQTKQPFAAKIVSKQFLQSTTRGPSNEIEILKKVRHPNVIALQDVFETNSHLFIIMELVTGGELFDEIIKRGSFGEDDAAHIMVQIASAVKYIHSLGIVHRDLKPENLLFATPEAKVVKIADFGLSKIVGPEALLFTPCGTPACVAPEVLISTGYGKEVDLWALGVILYILLCGYPPFQNGVDEGNYGALYEQIIGVNYSFDEMAWASISESAKDLVSKLLVADSRKRYTAEQILDHPWIVGHTRKEMKKPDSPPPILQEMKKFNERRRMKRSLSRSLSTILLENVDKVSDPSTKDYLQRFLSKSNLKEET